MRDVVAVDGLATSPGYSHAVRAGNLLVVSGQVAQDETGAVVGPGDPVAQTRQVFANLRRALAAGGATFDDVVRLTIYVTDPAARPAVVAARLELFAEPRPASTYLVVAGLADPAYLVEVEAMAYLEGGGGQLGQR